MRVGAAAQVVRADLGADAVLERRDDLAARRVVLGVRGEDDQHVERQAHRVALDLDVAFLQDVEQADLDLAGEVGQLVDGEDAAIGARQQAEVHRQLVAELQAALGGLDRIDVADHVGDRHVRRRQLLDVARLARPPATGIWSPSALTRAWPNADSGASGSSLISLSGNHRHPLVEQRRQRAQDARLGLAAQAEQDEVVPRQHGIHQLRDDRVVVADDAGEQRVFPPQVFRQVLAHLVSDRAAAHLAPGDGGFQLCKCFNPWRGRHISIITLAWRLRRWRQTFRFVVVAQWRQFVRNALSQHRVVFLQRQRIDGANAEPGLRRSNGSPNVYQPVWRDDERAFVPAGASGAMTTPTRSTSGNSAHVPG